MDNRKYIIKHILLWNAAVEKAKRSKAPAAEMAQKQKEQQQKCVESVQNLIISNMINLCILYFYQYPTIYAYNMFNWTWAVYFEVQFHSFRV